MLQIFGVVTFILVLAASEARAQTQTIVVTPANPVVAVGDTQQFTATGNLIPDVVSVGGFHTCALQPDTTLRCWGENLYGKLGDGTTTNSSSPVAVSGITTATSVAAGFHHTCAALSDGTVRCWGRNEFGQLGNGATADSSTPVAVSGITTATAVTAGGFHSCALLADDTVRCWGRNDFGQLGDATMTSSSTPVMVTGLGVPATITAGGFHTCALLPDGAVQCWGRNTYGQLGDGTTNGSSVPVWVSGLAPATTLTAGGYHTCAQVPDSTVWCWGRNTYGQLGDGSSLTYSTSSFLLGQTGLDTATAVPGSHSRRPVRVSDISTAAGVTAGAWHTCAPLADGSASCWGRNDFGQLGDGTTTSTTTPVRVIGLSEGVIALAAGAYHTCARLPDATVQCWGWNYAGQLGNGMTSDGSTPVTVVGSGPAIWTSSDTAVATIDAASGLATAVSPGSTTITATANGIRGRTLLTVVNFQ